MIAWLRRLFTPPDAMSASWLKAQERDTSKIEYHGPSIAFPVKKRINEAASWQTRILKKKVG